MDSAYDYLFKVIVLGDSGVGKTAVLNRFTDGTFRENDVSTIGVDFKIKFLDINGKRIKLQAWDTAGQERYRSLITSYYKGSHGVIFVYDVNDRASFESITTWCKDIEGHHLQGIDKILLGNKLDLAQRVVSQEEARQFARQHNMLLFESSAKTGQMISDAFAALSEVMMQTMDDKLVTKGQSPRSPRSEEGSKPGVRLDDRRRNGKGFLCCS